MRKIGLIDSDGHRFPNLALMRISAYHKSLGDEVEWWWTNMIHYDIVYISKIFSEDYSGKPPDVWNADRIVVGGTGFCITMVNGKEIFDSEKNILLPNEIEKMFPDYSIYPQYDFAVSMTSRGCPRGCSFCHVAAKEGKCSKKVANVCDFWRGQREIKVLDPNLTACKDKYELYGQYIDTKAWIDFTQGLDIRLITAKDVELLNKMKIKQVHFAWDDASDRLEEKFQLFTENFRLKDCRRKLVYVLTNFNSTMDENLYRIYTLRDLGYNPYVMIYDKNHASKDIRKLQRWCNNRRIFWAQKDFYKYLMCEK